MSAKTLKALTEAILEQKDASRALLVALEMWKNDRGNTALADLIDAISEKASGEAITEVNEWSRVAGRKNPLDLGRLLPSMLSFNVSFLPGAGAMLAAGFADDPRLAIAVATWAEEPPTTSSSTYPFWTKVLDAAAKSRDPRVVPRLQSRLRKKPGDSQFWGKFYAALKKVITKIEEGKEAAPDPPIDKATLKKLGAGVAKLSKIDATATSASRSKTTRTDDTPKVTGTLLEQAATHLGAGRVQPAIDALVEHWRESRRPQVADLVDRATRLLPNWDRPISASAKETPDKWTELFADNPSANLPWLLLAVFAGGAAHAERHMIDLATLPDDPRISYRLAEVAVHFRISPERTQYWKSLWEIVARHRDVRVCESLAKEFRDFKGTYYNHHRQGKRIVAPFVLDPRASFADERWPLEVHEPADRRDFPNVEAALAGLEAKRDRTEHELLAAIAKDRADPAPYLVYADWLSERGHPRGELIVLATKKKRTAAEEKRSKELHGLSGIFGPVHELGDYGDVVHGLGRTIKIDYFVGALTWRKAAGHPLLSIVERIVLGGGSMNAASDVARMILHPDHAMLEKIEGVRLNDHADVIKLLEPTFRKEGRGTLVRARK